MNFTLIDKGNACRLVLAGRLTIEFAHELEDRIIDALRRYTRFEVDLAGVQKIDICGTHLLCVLNVIAGTRATVVAGSPVVERAFAEMAVPGATWFRAPSGSADGGRHPGRYPASDD